MKSEDLGLKIYKGNKEKEEMKEKLLKMLAAKEEQRKKLQASLIDSDTKEERSAINESLGNLDNEMVELRAMIENCDKPKEERKDLGKEMFGLGSKEFRQEELNYDVYNTTEYRNAFKTYIGHGTMDAKYRAATKTSDTGISVVIPTNLANYIQEKWEQLGVIYNLVTKTNYPVGQTIPVDGAKPTATWVNEGAGSTPQSKTLGTSIVFTHHKLRCEIRWTQEVDTMTLAMFENLFIKQVSDAMLRAIESAIVDGDGSGKPTGILNYAASIDADRKISLADGATNKITYKTLCDMEAAVPVQYEARAKWCMTKKTFMQFVGMVDSQGQPIARVNYGLGNRPNYTLLGRDVVLYVPQAGSKLGSYADSVTVDTIIAFIADFGDYVLNTNYNLGISHATDWDNEDHKTKAVLACDGKFLLSDSLVTLTKAKKSV